MVRLLCLVVVLLTSSCVYTLDIQQGNILDQKEVDKLRVGLSKNQVIFVLGNPVADDSFSDDHWVYIYTFTNEKREINRTKKLELFFTDGKLLKASGDYTIPEGLAVKKAK
jgi:outer membrane protein assembly factor BamE